MMLGRKKRTPHLLNGLGALLLVLALPDALIAAAAVPLLPLPFTAMLARRALERVAVAVAAAGEAGPGEAEREEPPAVLRRVRTIVVGGWYLVLGLEVLKRACLPGPVCLCRRGWG